MSAGVNMLCYKSKTLANGENPLIIRVCKDGKKKSVSLIFEAAESITDTATEIASALDGIFDSSPAISSNEIAE